MSEQGKSIDAVVKGTSFDSLRCTYCHDEFNESDDLKLVRLKTALGETRVPYHAACADDHKKEEEATAKKAAEREKRLREMKQGLITHPYDGLEFEAAAHSFDSTRHKDRHGKLTMDQRLEVLKTGEIETRWPKRDYQRTAQLGFDKSLEQVELRGYTRHPRTQEMFSIIFGGLDGSLPEKLKPIFVDMIGHVRYRNYLQREYVGLAMKVEQDKLRCYVDPKFICGFDVRDETLWCELPKKELLYSQCQEFDLPHDVVEGFKRRSEGWTSQEKSLSVSARDLGEYFLHFIYGKTEFADTKYSEVFAGKELPFSWNDVSAERNVVKFGPRIEIPFRAGTYAVYANRRIGSAGSQDSSTTMVMPHSVFNLALHYDDDDKHRWSGRGVRQKNFIKRLFGK